METPRDLLIEGLQELGIEPVKKTLADFMDYMQELKKWNKVHNITSITDDYEIVAKHFLDSLLYLKAIPAGAKTVCDVGSGGGFPGLPLAIVRPDLQMTLIEPARKKAAFLKQMRRLLERRDIEVIEERIDDVENRQFDVVLTRATFSAVDFIGKAGHAVKPGGILLLSKGPKFEEELKALGADVRFEVVEAEISHAGVQRNLIRIQRIS